MDPIRNAIDRLNVHSPAVLLALAAQPNLRLLCATWPMLDVRTRRRGQPSPYPEGLDIPALRDWMWQEYQMDRPRVIVQLKAALGALFPAKSVLDQGIELMAVFPYGIVNKAADAYVKAEAQRVLSDLRASLGRQGGSST